MVCFMASRLVSNLRQVFGTFKNYDAHHLIFGNEDSRPFVIQYSWVPLYLHERVIRYIVLRDRDHMKLCRLIGRVRGLEQIAQAHVLCPALLDGHKSLNQFLFWHNNSFPLPKTLSIFLRILSAHWNSSRNHLVSSWAALWPAE